MKNVNNMSFSGFVEKVSQSGGNFSVDVPQAAGRYHCSAGAHRRLHLWTVFWGSHGFVHQRAALLQSNIFKALHKSWIDTDYFRSNDINSYLCPFRSDQKFVAKENSWIGPSIKSIMTLSTKSTWKRRVQVFMSHRSTSKSPIHLSFFNRGWYSYWSD